MPNIIEQIKDIEKYHVECLSVKNTFQTETPAMMQFECCPSPEVYIHFFVFLPLCWILSIFVIDFKIPFGLSEFRQFNAPTQMNDQTFQTISYLNFVQFVKTKIML